MTSWALAIALLVGPGLLWYATGQSAWAILYALTLIVILAG